MDLFRLMYLQKHMILQIQISKALCLESMDILPEGLLHYLHYQKLRQMGKKTPPRLSKCEMILAHLSRSGSQTSTPPDVKTMSNFSSNFSERL